MTNPTAGISSVLTVTPTADDADSFGNIFRTNYTGSLAYSGQIAGAINYGKYSGTGSLANVYGAYNVAENSSTGAITNAYGTQSNVLRGSNTITNAYGVHVSITGAPGIITNGYGLYIAAPMGTITNNYAIYSEGSLSKSYFAGKVGIGTTSPYTALSVLGEVVATNFTATSTTATTTIAGGLNVGNGAILYDYSSGVASVGNLELGSLSFDTNAGTVNWMDMPVTSSATVGTVQSYSAQLDGTALITAYSQSDGAGNIKLSAVGIGTTTPTARLTVTTATSTENIPLFTVASSTGTTLFTILNSGYVGIGTTTSAVNNTLVVQGGVCITGGTTCPAVSSGSLSLDTAGADGGNPGVFDVAERYPAREVMSAGEIAALDTESEDTALIKKGTQGDVLLGIVSTRAAVAINGNDLTLAPAGEATSTKPLIALAGRVPVKVTMEGGAIKKGDRITASSVAGVGMKATSTAQQTVGIALEGFSGTDEGTVLVFVQTSASRLDPAIADGTILDGNGESSFWSVEEGSGRIKFISQGIDLNDQDIVSVRAIIGSAGKWSIDANGRLVVGEVEANKVTTKTLCIDDVCIEKDALRALLEKNGVTQPAAVINSSQPTTDNIQPTPEPVLPPPAEGEVVTEPKPEEASPPPVETPAPEPEVVQIQEPEPALAGESASTEPPKSQGEALENPDLTT